MTALQLAVFVMLLYRKVFAIELDSVLIKLCSTLKNLVRAKLFPLVRNGRDKETFHGFPYFKPGWKDVRMSRKCSVNGCSFFTRGTFQEPRVFLFGDSLCFLFIFYALGNISLSNVIDCLQLQQILIILVNTVSWMWSEAKYAWSNKKKQKMFNEIQWLCQTRPYRTLYLRLLDISV